MSIFPPLDLQRHRSINGAHQIFHFLRDYIPERLHREAKDALVSLFTTEGVEITDTKVRAQFERMALNMTGITDPEVLKPQNQGKKP